MLTLHVNRRGRTFWTVVSAIVCLLERMSERRGGVEVEEKRRLCKIIWEG